MFDRIQNTTLQYNTTSFVSTYLGKQKRSSSFTQEETEKPDAVNFVLMLKKNNKQVLKDLNIPLTSDLAANLHHKQLAERAEH